YAARSLAAGDLQRRRVRYGLAAADEENRGQGHLCSVVRGVLAQVELFVGKVLSGRELQTVSRPVLENIQHIAGRERCGSGALERVAGGADLVAGREAAPVRGGPRAPSLLERAFP